MLICTLVKLNKLCDINTASQKETLILIWGLFKWWALGGWFVTRFYPVPEVYTVCLFYFFKIRIWQTSLSAWPSCWRKSRSDKRRFISLSSNSASPSSALYMPFQNLTRLQKQFRLHPCCMLGKKGIVCIIHYLLWPSILQNNSELSTEYFSSTAFLISLCVWAVRLTLVSIHILLTLTRCVCVCGSGLTACIKHIDLLTITLSL